MVPGMRSVGQSRNPTNRPTVPCFFGGRRVQARRHLREARVQVWGTEGRQSTGWNVTMHEIATIPVLASETVLYHGTPLGCVPSILKDGLLPSSVRTPATESICWKVRTLFMSLRFPASTNSQRWAFTSQRLWRQLWLTQRQPGPFVFPHCEIFFALYEAVFENYHPSAKWWSSCRWARTAEANFFIFSDECFISRPILQGP